MPLYHVYRTDNHLSYDQHDAMVIRSRTKKGARKIAIQFAMSFEKKYWENEKGVSVDAISDKGSSGVIVASFNAG